MGQSFVASAQAHPFQDQVGPESTASNRAYMSQSSVASVQANPFPDRTGQDFVASNRAYMSQSSVAFAQANPLQERVHPIPLPEAHNWTLQGGEQTGQQDLLPRLRELEFQLANPKDVRAVGHAYRRLQIWIERHRYDVDLPQQLNSLERESQYPAWRRQALQEAYALFFEEAAKTGNGFILSELPEPPTSKDMGWLPLPESLASSSAARKAVVSRDFTDGSNCFHRRFWEYDIQRRELEAGEVVCGREIVPGKVSDRYCEAAVNPVSRAMVAILGKEACCAQPRQKPMLTAQYLPRAPRRPPADANPTSATSHR